MLWKRNHSRKESWDDWIKDIYARFPIGSEITVLGKTLRIIRHGFHDGSDLFEGFEAVYLDDAGCIRRMLIYPADLEGILPPKNGYVDHIDGNPENNQLSNLKVRTT